MKNTNLYYDKMGDMLELCIGKPTDAFFDEVQDGIFIRIDEKTKTVKGFMIFALKKRIDKSPNLQYDEEKDTLYVRIGEPLDCSYKEVGDNVFVRLDEKTKQPNGFKVVGLKKRMIRLNFHEEEQEEINITH